MSEVELVDEAIDNYLKLEELGEKISKRDIVSQATHQIDMVYRQSKQYIEALKYFRKEQELINMFFQDNFLFKAANNYEIGYTHLLLGNYGKSFSFLSKSLKEALQTEDYIMIACAQRGLGEYCLKMEKHSLALNYFNESIESFKRASDFYGVSEVKELIAYIKT